MSIRAIIGFALTIYFYAVFLWVILSWIPASTAHAVGRLQTFLDRMIYPVILPIRRVIPPVRIGGGALDLSPIVLLVGIQILLRLVR
ncbi:MAG: YggT family protein [Actinobacteria bacterium]|nr:YggT family protein [Actinomycetota bacterium]MCZ6519578.1 YggT family protein [Actinomycetota bacterium]MCZ6566733.1 YggT family protein [Actinomycetota bacterium]MCZ6630497.1 YggT family protein [Actinomycetota bacterium]MCZ6737986.1 YggT family protein [Actinomycetota bacterium]